MNWLSESSRRSAGRPPTIDEVALRKRYGEAAVELITLLYQLRDEGGFSIKQAAQAWARRHPEDPLAGKVLGRDGEVDQRRLSELMKMPQPLPRGLVQAFVDLWFAGRERGEAQQRAALQTVDRLNVLDATVRAASATSLTRTALSTCGADAMIPGSTERVKKLRAELEEVQQERDRFRHLALALALAILRLDEQLDLLLGPTTRSPEIDPRTTAGLATALQAQLTRADQQRDQALQQIERAIVLATRLQEHLTQLHNGPELQRAESVGPGGLGPLPEHDPVLTDNEQALDRIEEMLPSPRLDHATSLVSTDDTEIVRPPAAVPDNPVARENGEDYATPWRTVRLSLQVRNLTILGVCVALIAIAFGIRLLLSEGGGNGGPSTQPQASTPSQSTSTPVTTTPSSAPSQPLLVLPIHPDYPFSFYFESSLPNVSKDPNGHTTLTWDIEGEERTIYLHTGRGQPRSNFGSSMTIKGSLLSTGDCAPTVRFIEGDLAITERLSVTLPDGGARPAAVRHLATGEWLLYVKILPSKTKCSGKLTWTITGVHVP